MIEIKVTPCPKNPKDKMVKMKVEGPKLDTMAEMVNVVCTFVNKLSPAERFAFIATIIDNT